MAPESNPFFIEETPKPEEPSGKRRLKGKSPLTAALIIGGLLLALVALVVLAPGDGQTAHDKSWSSLHNNIAAIDITGAIEEEGETYNQQWLEATIDNARLDTKNKAILLRIDSPGGTIYESDATWQALMRYKKETKRPIYAYGEHLMASGGYYIASAADNIGADRNSLVGSIGVIGGRFVDATGLFDKLGVKTTTVHTGANKLMGGLTGPPTEEQIAIMQRLSDEAYDQFVDIVSKGRKMSPEEVKALADGRIYTSRQALANGLLDEVMSYDAYEKGLKKRLKDDNIKVVPYAYNAPRTLGIFPLGQQQTGLLKNLFGGNDLTAAVQTLKDLQITEPMYLYEG